MIKHRHIRKSFVKQLDRSDCGVACLLSIIQYFGGSANLENLRESSGTTKQGTTMLGLYNTALKYGLTPQGLEGNIDFLKTIDNLCILHVTEENQFYHYLVYYGFDGSNFVIGDPSSRIEKYSPGKLEKLWESKCLLLLTPNSDFIKNTSGNDARKRWIIKFLHEDVDILSVVAILGLLVSILGLATIVFSQQLIDKILPEANNHKLIISLTFVSLLLLVRAGVSYIRSYLSNIQSRNFNNRLISGFYKSLLFLPKSFFNSRKTGELVARMEDTFRIQQVIAYLFSELINDAFFVLVSLGTIFYYSSTPGIITFCFIPVYFLLAFLYNEKIGKHQYEVMAANANKTGNYVNTIQGIDAIKTHNKEEQFSRLNKAIYGTFQEKIFTLGKTSLSIQFLTDMVSIVSVISVISVCSFMVLNRGLTIGEFAAIISISTNILPTVGNIAFSNIRLKGARVAFDRMFEFTGISPEYIPNIEEHKPDKLNFYELTVSNLSFCFPGRREILKGLSMEIKKGSIAALVGESGCGKTTFLNILLKLYQPDCDSIRLNEDSFNTFPTYAWRNIVGVVPQEISLFNGTLLDNICLVSSQEEYSKCYKFCVDYGFDTYFKDFPQNYSTLLGEEGVNLSGGQKQLIAFARALYKNPQVLLLDEPTSSMDMNKENFIFDLILQLRPQMGILIITHRNRLAELADRIYFLHGGTVTTIGKINDLALS